MEFRWQSAVGAVANVYTAIAFAAAAVSTIFGWAKWTRTLTAEWPLPIQIAFYVALFVLLFVVFVVVSREVRAAWGYLTRNTLGAVKASATQGERVERVNDDQWSAIDTLRRDALDHMRSNKEHAEEELRRSRQERDASESRFREAEKNAEDHARTAQAAIGAEAMIRKTLKEVEAELSDVQSAFETTKPLRDWAEQLIKNARERVSDQIEIVDYQFHTREIDEKVSAGFGVSVRLRYWGVFPAVIGGSVVNGAHLRFQGRRMSAAPEVSTLILHRGQTDWLHIRQLLGQDAEAVRADWHAGSIKVDASHVRLPIRCDDPTGGEQIEGSLVLEEMEWPKPSK